MVSVLHPELSQLLRLGINREFTVHAVRLPYYCEIESTEGYTPRERLRQRTGAGYPIATSRNGNQEMLVQVFAGGVFLQIVQRAHSPAGKERQEIQLARLQRFVGIEKVAEKLRVTGEHAGLFVASPACFLPEFFGLIGNLALGFFESRLQRRIDSGDGVVPAVEQLANLAHIFLKFGAQLGGQVG